MPETRNTRRLAAILASDVVGYSRMMGADESGTLSALKRHRETIFDPTVAANNGRIVKLIGDGTLVEFGSVVDAVKCALAVQRAIAAEAAAGSKITLRIGINLGDIIIEGDDIYGDGVNVAARLEPLAEPGGVCVASIVNESIGNRIDVAFNDAGEVQVKNIDRPIRVWKWHPGTAATAPVAAAAPPVTPAKPQPSVAVLPFNNMSGDAEQEYFSDGMSEDIITDLSKIAGLRVIARNSSFVYKGRSVDIRAVGRELGVTSVLEGSIRRAGNRLRITAQLIEAATGSHLWAERYDRDLNDIFEVQDDVTRRIVDALKVTLTPAEAAELTEPNVIVSVEAHDAVLRAREMLRQPNKDRALFEQMVVLFKRAIDLDPENSDAYAGLAMTHGLDFQNGWSTTPEISRNLALQLSQTAIAKNPKNAFARYVASLGFAFNGRPDLALREVEIALELEPNNAQAFNARGAARIFSGEPRAAIPDIERGMSLDPGFSQQYLHFLGIAHYMLGNYETAAAHFRERILLAPQTDFSRGFLVATLGQLGDKAGAAVIWRELMDVNPQYTVRAHIDHLAFQRPADKEHVADGFRKAGYL